MGSEGPNSGPLTLQTEPSQLNVWGFFFLIYFVLLKLFCSCVFVSFPFLPIVLELIPPLKDNSAFQTVMLSYFLNHFHLGYFEHL